MAEATKFGMRPHELLEHLDLSSPYSVIVDHSTWEEARQIPSDKLLTNFSTVVRAGRVLVVDDAFGDDALAVPDRLDMPFKTIAAAWAMAADGDSIEVRNGIYVATTLPPKSRIRWYFHPNTTLQFTGAGITFIDDGNFADVIVIRGSLKLEFLNTAGADCRFMNLQHLGTVGYVELMQINDQRNGGGARVIESDAYSLHIDVKLHSYFVNSTFVFLVGGRCFVRATDVDHDGALHAFIATGGSFHLNIDYFVGTNFVQFTSIAGAITVRGMLFSGNAQFDISSPSMDNSINILSLNGHILLSSGNIRISDTYINRVGGPCVTITAGNVIGQGLAMKTNDPACISGTGNFYNYGGVVANAYPGNSIVEKIAPITVSADVI